MTMPKSTNWEIVSRRDVKVDDGVAWLPLGWTVRRHEDVLVFEKTAGQRFSTREALRGVTFAWTVERSHMTWAFWRHAAIVFCSVLPVLLLANYIWPPASFLFSFIVMPFGVFCYERRSHQRRAAEQQGLRKKVMISESRAVPSDELSFDLENNWGSVPMEQRVRLAKAEIASGIQGYARAEGVRWWNENRRSQMGRKEST